MMKVLIAALGLVVCCPAFADLPSQVNDSPGWHWYNDPEEEQETDAPAAPPPPVLSAEEKMARLQKETKTALAKAIMEPTIENFARFKRLQDFWTTQASKFSMAAQASMLAHPELDYNLQHSHYNGTAKLQQAGDRADEQSAIARLTAQNGVFFFYRGKEAMDNQMAEVVKNFAKSNGIALIAITVDGAASASMPGTRPDTGQAKRMGISHFPALFLVNPRDETSQPLAYGFIAQDDLAKRFLYVATGFEPNF
ncbi:type-F conjugative transfer system pilin assembly protein TraF [Erwinia billingiae]|uniref:type-F conjugative transfer system pilin assembly protein TraF n=1 Tax=Erwinia billingiae TaxID=182337 RepID=UPI003D187348